jgi:gliding motility-associated-like protein
LNYKQNIIFLFFIFIYSSLHAQYYNESVEVDSIYNYNQNNPDTIFIHDILSSIQDSDIVLLHQGKGIKWNYNSGTVASDYGFAGRFEIHVVLKRISKSVIVRNIAREGTVTYVPKGLQLLRVGRYLDIMQTKTISSNIVAEPWNGKKGGIICIIGDTVKLLANIDASGKGYKGATPTNSNTVTCWASDSANVGKKNLPYSKKQWAGLKGESCVDEDTSYNRGFSPQYSGGGGGNGYHSGGGGGGNFFSGGLGGYEALLCASSPDTIGGRGGKGMGSGLLSGTSPIITFGGGGGCSTQKNGFIASSGGNGGGIIIIIANILIGNNYSIIANGQTVTDTATAGAGGGGAAGTIVLDVNEYSGSLKVILNGGHGGSVRLNTPIPGMGGGGAGGYLRYNGSSMNSNISLTFSGGNPGNMSPKVNKNAYPGMSGFSKGNFITPVKDFLFNLMPAVQNICEGDVPSLIKASTPKGATNIFRYVWRKSSDKINWQTIDTATRMTYQPPALFSTTYYQRIVHAVDINNIILVSDTSFTYAINVLPKITNNTIHTDTFAICKGLPMPQMFGSLPAGGNGTYQYLWQDSTSSNNWKTANGNHSGINYKPIYSDTVFLRRYVTSGVCHSYSNTFEIKVLPKITNYFITDTQWVSLGNNFIPLEANNALGGDMNYTYIWQKSDNLTKWNTIDSSHTNKVQVLAQPLQPDTFYYRRIVYSGLFNTCKDTTKVLPLYVLDSIQNNIISGNDTICARTAPKPFYATQPHGGDNHYRYLWQSSLDAITWDSLSNSDNTVFNPGILNHSTYFRRIVFSGKKNACIDTSNIIFIFTKPAIENNLIYHSKDTSICYGHSPGLLTGSIPLQGDGPYVYLWETSSIDTFTNAAGENNQISYQFDTLYNSIKIRRKVTSGICISYSDTLNIKVLPPLSNNYISGDTTVCKKTSPEYILGSIPEGGDNTDYRYQWISSSDNNLWTSCHQNSTNIHFRPAAIDTLTYFKRVVLSGLNNTCIDTSNFVTINTFQLPNAKLIPFEDSLCLGENFTLNIQTSGKAPFTLKYTDQNAVFDTTVNTTGKIQWQIWPYTQGIFQYQLVQVKDVNGCSPDSLPGKGELSIFEVPKAFAGSDTEVCGLETILSANKGIGIGKWIVDTQASFENGEHSNFTKASVEQYGTHHFTWKLNNGGCIDSSTIQVIFYQPPPSPLVGDNQEGPFLFKTKIKAYLPIFGKGEWTTPDTTIIFSDIYDPEATVENLKFGKNYFQWYVKNGACAAASDTLVITVKDIRIPEGFSPNKDGKNDTFYIKGLENVTNAELIILNRWGTVLYHSRDYKNDWDGTSHGSILPLDTYYYILNVIGRTYKGYLIIRK